MSLRAALVSGVVTAGLVLLVVWLLELPLDRAAVLAPVLVSAVMIAVARNGMPQPDPAHSFMGPMVTLIDEFSADAFQGDMGLTSPIRPSELPNPEGLTDDDRPGLDVSVEDVNTVADYVRSSGLE